jgi:glucosamine--fructose-6-phosphate aminotransferase (isomerizing)
VTERILAADVGGTHARLAVVEVGFDVNGQAKALRVERFAVFDCAKYPSLTAICAAFLQAETVPPARGVIAIAGIEVGDRIESIALPWEVSLSAMREALALAPLAFINDFIAAALGVGELAAADIERVSAPGEVAVRATNEPMLVLGPGTGFGAAVLVPKDGELIAVGSEAGQVAVAPGTDLELDILRALRGENDLLSIGDLLSGPGLSRLDGFLRARGRPFAQPRLTPTDAVPTEPMSTTLRSSAEIIRAALQDNDPGARQAVEEFCELLGSFAGDLALIYKAHGGVYLAGGILPRIKPLLRASRFMERFTAKGSMRGFLQRIPVYLVEHPHLGVLGAARWYTNQQSARRPAYVAVTAQVEQQTKLFREAASAPQIIAAQFEHNRNALETIGRRLRAHPPRAVVTCARGSSDHATTYARYLIETRTGTLTSSATPSVYSLYDTKSRLHDCLFLAISQSGASPDVLAATAAAKAAGAWTIAFTNVISSPLATLVDEVVPLGTGEESSVAASKSYLASLSAMLQLVSHWSGQRDLLEALAPLPEQLQMAWQLDWSAALPVLQPAVNMYTIGRGLGLGIAQEAALKFKETCGLHAEAHSGAELRHGPLALVRANFPLLMFAQDDKTRAGIEALAADLKASGAQLLLAGLNVSGACVLPTLAAHPAISPLLMIQSFYRMANTLALVRGFDPDQPPRVNKVTETL